MMKNIVLLSCFVLAVGGYSIILSPKVISLIAATNSPGQNQPPKELWNYKEWTRVNATPVKMEASIAVMCAPAPSQLRNESPHKDKFIVVYVNQAGQKAMMTERNPQFPSGSIIVKEKLPAAESLQPELLTAMVKREKGFNPAGNDWEFFVLSGDAKTAQAQGKLDNCMACHTAQRSNDFVFRNYLSNTAMMNLR